ncbi:hypothetical protein [Armatimonas sp.]|uniref:hypothetical protein n=1 Tax=Armatimonas sp. TaxID=1872638 RepID=UPI00375072A1
MAKISKPVGWFAFLAVVGGVAFYFLGDSEGGKRRTAHSPPKAKITAPPGFPESDMTATFVRLTSPLRDSFTPKIVVAKPQPPGGGASVVAKPTWALTGIYVYNGVKLALLENAATGESKSVKAGETWMGQQILSVTASGVMLANGAQMVFVEPPSETQSSVMPVLLPNGPTVPGVGVPRQGVAADPQSNRPLTINLPPGVAPTQSTRSQP